MATLTTMPPPVVAEASGPPRPAADGPAAVAYVLLLVQAAAGLLAMLGLVLIMGGNPAYALVPSIKPVLLLVLATAVVRGRRRAAMAVIVIELVSLTGYGLNLLIGLVPQVDVTVNLVTLLTNVALPVAIVVLCRQIRAEQAAR
ncbi:MAG: hypothetical protein L0Y54_14000 [Sporichthyaceae bacterium]|nr:hypothetical protein [Sporichthyaceae bacterium]